MLLDDSQKAADEEEGEDSEQIEDPPSPADFQLAIDLVLFLEYELAIDVSRLRIKARGGVVHAQGSVDTHEQRDEIEREIPKRPSVKSLTSYIAVEHHDSGA